MSIRTELLVKETAVVIEEEFGSVAGSYVPPGGNAVEVIKQIAPEVIKQTTTVSSKELKERISGSGSVPLPKKSFFSSLFGGPSSGVTTARSSPLTPSNQEPLL